MLSFQNKKALKFVITLGTGTFGSSNANQITLQGLRATVDINKAGGMMMGELHAQIWGVRQSDINSVTTLQWKPRAIIPNTVAIYAIDGTQETLIFQGNIVNAWGNYEAMPDAFLMIQAQAAYFNQLQAVAPTSIKGNVDVATLMGQIVATMNKSNHGGPQYTFENNGVNVQLSNPYLPNTALEQIKALARAAGCDLYLDDTVLAITPANSPRLSTIIPEISSASGLVGYPTFDGIGVNFRTVFNPAIRFGGSFQLVTDLT